MRAESSLVVSGRGRAPFHNEGDTLAGEAVSKVAADEAAEDGALLDLGGIEPSSEVSDRP